MKAIKGNTVYDITEQEKQSYISRGFDIQDEDGNIVSYGKGKSVPFSEYEKVRSELEKLKTERETKPPKKENK